MITLRKSRTSAAQGQVESAKHAAEAARAKATEQAAVIKEQASALREKVGPGVEQGISTTRSAAGQARQWAEPRVVAAAEKVGPALVVAKERFQEDVRPKLEEALAAAAVTGAAAATTALQKTAQAAEAAAAATATVPDRIKLADGVVTVAVTGDTLAGRHKGRRRRRIALLVLAAAAAGAVAVILRRRGELAEETSWEYVPASAGAVPLGADEEALEDAIAAAGSAVEMSTDANQIDPDLVDADLIDPDLIEDELDDDELLAEGVGAGDEPATTVDLDSTEESEESSRRQG